MADILSILSVLPGVAGACLLQPGKAPVYAEAGTIEIDRIQQVGVQAAMLFSHGQSPEFRFTTTKFAFDRYTITALLLADRSLLVIACEPQANSSLLINTVKKMLPGA